MFVFNIELPQSGRQILKYMYTINLVNQIIKKTFVEANGCQNNRKQIICGVLRAHKLLQRLKSYYERTLKQI